MGVQYLKLYVERMSVARQWLLSVQLLLQLLFVWFVCQAVAVCLSLASLLVVRAARCMVCVGQRARKENRTLSHFVSTVDGQISHQHHHPSSSPITFRSTHIYGTTKANNMHAHSNCNNMTERREHRPMRLSWCLLAVLALSSLRLEETSVSAFHTRASLCSSSSSSSSRYTQRPTSAGRSGSAPVAIKPPPATLLASVEKEFSLSIDQNTDDLLRVVDEDATAAPAAFACHFCHSPFASRNAVFRHLRADGCSSDNPCSPGDGTDPIVKQSIAILFGYVNNNSNNNQGGSHSNDANSPTNDKSTMIPVNEWAGQQVYKAVQEMIRNYNNNNNNHGDDDEPTTRINLDFRLQESRTQSSMARLRSRILQQDPDCSAAGDVLLVTGTCLESSLPQVADALSVLPGRLESKNEREDVASIRIWSCKLLAADVTFHAERSCTQMVYHYLVPLSWLPDADLLKHQWNGWKEKPPTDSLRRFKAALRSAESGMVSMDGSGSSSSSKSLARQPKVAAGRFGRLGAKERRAWHNFADPSLQGGASPNQEPVWRVVDACRMIGMVHFGQDDACLVVEIKGDAFCPQQCRRIVGTALAIAHGWIDVPEQDLWKDFLLNPTCVMETVLAPPNRLYLADARFHFEESRTSGKPLFETNICGKLLTMHDGTNALKWTQQQVLQSRSADTIETAELEWLEKVHDETAPRIRDSLLQQAALSRPIDAAGTSLVPTPPEYEEVLQKLRAIVRAGRWPETSMARSSVISDIGRPAGGDGGGTGGSFTVINTKLYDTMQTSQDSINLPLGNQHFPDLVAAVFALEEAIAQYARKAETESGGKVKLFSDFTSRRPQSTHCAINCNAQFTPHVDSGRGAGQSLSIIVGLGDYQKGEET